MLGVKSNERDYVAACRALEARTATRSARSACSQDTHHEVHHPLPSGERGARDRRREPIRMNRAGFGRLASACFDELRARFT
jgi:hypothetical protein